MTGLPTCLACKSEHGEADAFCGVCGAALSVVEPPAARSASAHSRQRRGRLGVAAAVVLAAGAAVAAYLLRPHSATLTGTAWQGAAEPVSLRLDESNSRTVWTTNVYDYGAGGTGGAGKADDRLRVGGYGDQYVSLIAFTLRDARVPRRALLRLTIAPDAGMPTPIEVTEATGGWSWSGGWMRWQDLPPTRHLFEAPAPVPGARSYDLDITDIYARWAQTPAENHGLVLRPVLTQNNYSTFYSSRAQPSARPLVLLSY
jgi:hypothetical protein